MSLIIAYKKDNIFYLCCDTQRSVGDFKENYISEHNFKIVKMTGRTLIGCVGEVLSISYVKQQLEKIVISDQQSLTKKLVMKKIVNPIWEILRSYDLLNEEDGVKSMAMSFIICKDDKCFKVLVSGGIIEISDFVVIGSALDSILPYLWHPSSCDIKSLLYRVCKKVVAVNNCISGPFVMIDTKSLRYSIME